VISDYQTIRLSLKAHPMHFLRAHYERLKFVTAEQLTSLKDGRRLSMAGVVLIRQRPGTSKGVVFITIEDETGIANLVVWPHVFEKQRKIVMGARLMAVHGVVQKDPDSNVIHVVAGGLEDHTHLLSRLSDDSLLPARLEKADHAGSWGRPPNRHPRNVEIIPKSRDFH
jgi:error-prone DNA polymerase